MQYLLSMVMIVVASIIVISLSSSLVVALAETDEVEEINLFMIGNSYIRRNKMYEMVDALFNEGLRNNIAEDDTTIDISVSRYTKSGGQLYELWYDEDVDIQSMIVNDFTHVVLQEQSQIPGFYGASEYNDIYFQPSLDAITELNDIISSSGANTILMMTWGRRDGDKRNQWFYPNFEIMQQRITDGYYLYQDAIATERRPVKIAPVGLAFERIYNLTVEDEGVEEDTLFSNLYSSDGSHPSTMGTYLGACVIYATITGKNPQELQWMPSDFSSSTSRRRRRSSSSIPNVDEDLRDFLQLVAYETVVDFEEKLNNNEEERDDKRNEEHDDNKEENQKDRNNNGQTRGESKEEKLNLVEIQIKIKFDSYPQETGWRLMDRNTGNVDTVLIDVLPGKYPYPMFSNEIIYETLTVPEGGYYRFEITDTYGDGFFSIGDVEHYSGYYSIKVNGAFVAFGSHFEYMDYVDFVATALHED